MEHYQIFQHIHNESSKSRGEKGTERIFEEIMAKNFPYLIKDMNLHIQESQQTSKRINLK